MRKYVLVLAMAAAGLLAFQPAYAAESGGASVYAGGHGGMSFMNTAVSPAPGFELDGIGGSGWIGGGHIGVDYTGANRLFGGVFAGYDWQSSESSLTMGAAKYSVGLDTSWYVGGRAGVDTGKYKFYALAAYRQTDVEWNVGPVGSVKLPDKIKGIDLGLGAAMMIAPNVELGLEGIWTKYGDEKIISGSQTLANLETQQLSVLARLSFKLGGPPEIANPFSGMSIPDDPPAASGDPKLSAPRKR